MCAPILATALLVTAALAFPWITPGGIEALLQHPHTRQEVGRRLKAADVPGLERRQVVTGAKQGVVTLLDGTLEAVIDNVVGLIPTNDAVKGLQRFPEDDYPFLAPGPTDQRGPCPGLNTLANHGYIPRSGIATIGQINAASARVFNMGDDVGTFLSTGGALYNGDLLSQEMSIGGADDRVRIANGTLNGIFGIPSGVSGHGRFNEGDASATRLDFYLNGGDNQSFQPQLFKALHQQALAQGNGTYSVSAVKEHFKNRYAESRAANPQFYFNLPTAGVVMGAYYFIPGFFSNGTIGDGGVANEASVTSFYGAQPDRSDAWQDPHLNYTRVPERIPEIGWYRRSTPLTLAETVTNALDIFLDAQPALGGSGGNQSWVVGPLDVPNNPQAFSCFLYNALYANIPSGLFGTVDVALSVVNFVSALLSPGYKALGCTINYPDVSAPNFTSQWAAYVNQYVGPAKTEAVGSAWYGQA